MSDTPLPFWVILSDGSIRSIPMTQKLQKDMSALFRAQRRDLIEGPPGKDDTVPRVPPLRIPFDPGYTLSEGETVVIDGEKVDVPIEMFVIDGYKMREEIVDVVKNPLSQIDLSIDEDTLANIVGIFTGESRPLWIAAQTFDRRRLISTKGVSLIHERNKFKRIEEPGLTLDNKLAAVWEDGQLVFRSYAVTHRLFDLSDHFKTATDNDLRAIAEHAHLHVADVETFVTDADSWTRKEVSLIKTSGVLDKAGPRTIKKAAKDYGVPITIRKIGNKEKIELPPDRKELKDVLHFLNEDYFTSVILKRKYVSNSKRLLAAAKKQAKAKSRRASARLTPVKQQSRATR